MYHKPLNKKTHLIKRIAVCTVMTLSVVTIVAFVTLFILGYRFDSSKGQLEQYALLQFNSTPSGATITLNGEALETKTPSKSAVKSGTYEITISKKNYKTWTKTVNIKAGTLEWLNYALLVPEILTVESVAQYDSLYSSLASPNGHSILIQKQSSVPTFNLVDISSDVVKTSEITIAPDAYSDATVVGVVHSFMIDKWDGSGRYLLIKHTYGDKFEWLVMDTQGDKITKNITKIFDLAIISIDFSGTSGNIFYALDTNEVRKLDLSAGTMSRPLASGVVSFDVYNSDIFTFIGVLNADTHQQNVGFYRDGDESAYILKTITNTDNSIINIAAARYFNEDYVAISVGSNLELLKGSYPNSSTGDISSLKLLTTENADFNIDNLSFSPSGQYVLMQSGANFVSYDLEYQTLAVSAVEGDGSTPYFKWLNSSHLLTDRDGNLSIREFDGANSHVINKVVPGQAMVLSDNGRYIYSVITVATGYQLQRVRLILP